MNAVKDMIPELVEKELAAANEQYSPFASMHEGYAVLLEEVEEAKEALDMVDFHLGQMWRFIRADAAHLAKATAKALNDQAIQLVAEAIQVVAMARKFQAIGP